MILQISFSKFSDVLPALTFASAVSNLRSIFLLVNILNHSPCDNFNGNTPLLKA